MGFQVYNSQGQELQNLTGSAGGDLTGTYPNPTIATGAVVTADLAANAVTAAKIDATIAGYLALDNGATTRRYDSTLQATERTTTSTAYVDVSGATITVAEVEGGLTVVIATAEIRNPTSDLTAFSIYTDTPQVENNLSGTGGAIIGYGIGNSSTSPSGLNGRQSCATTTTSYVKKAALAQQACYQTRSTIYKVQFAGNNGAATQYIKNVRIRAWTIAP